jgi:hypothetical protein
LGRFCFCGPPSFFAFCHFGRPFFWIQVNQSDTHFSPLRHLFVTFEWQLWNETNLKMNSNPEVFMQIQTFSHIPSSDLSADFRSRFDLRTLTAFAIEAVHRVKPGSSTFVHNGQVFSEPMLLTVLTFCYASGIYASSEIEEAIRENEAVRYLCARVFPDSEDLRHYRRGNAAAIKRCLIELFTLADGSCAGGDNMFPTYATHSARQMLGASRSWMYVAEADRRVTLAIQADSIAMDA